MGLTRPPFFTFEGGEGAGKTTLIRRLQEQLEMDGYRVIATREPGGTPLGEQIRLLLLNHDPHIHIGSLPELLLFLTDRAQHIEETIRPALQEGAIVLCDRFNDSTVAYQGIARGLGKKKVQSLCDGVCGDVIPLSTFYLDLDPETGMERAKRDQRVMDRMETEKGTFHEKVREGFLELAKDHKDRIIVVDASQSPDRVFCEVMERMRLCLRIL